MFNHFAGLLTGSWRYAWGLRGFLSVRLSLDEAKQLLTAQLRDREASFLRVLELGVYANRENPYRRLLLHAGFELEDVRALVRDAGLEGALHRLHDAGVYVTLDEFKGRAPVRRPGLEFSVSAADFDNLLLTSHYETRTGGSRGSATRIQVDFESIRSDAANFLVMLHASGVSERQAFIWRATPPGMGLLPIFQFARTGRSAKRWFSPNKLRWNRQGIQSRALVAYTRMASKLFGRPIPGPRYMPDAAAIVPYLAEAVRQGRPALVSATQSQWVQACLAAERAGMDIRGTTFFGGGEPYTEGKAAVLQRMGVSSATCYGMHESGAIAWECGTPDSADDMHLLTNKLAVLMRPLQLSSGIEVQALYHTSLLASASKLMLNVESGDYGVVEERDCGCLWQEIGFRTHIHHVRSYEKLSSEGVMFMGSMLHELLEDTLPACFGGGPTDYQLVEEEEGGLPRVSVVISPRIGPVDEAAVLETVLDAVSFADWSRRMAESWRQAGTLRVQRREPYATGAGKILPLHLPRSAPGTRSAEPSRNVAPAGTPRD